MDDFSLMEQALRRTCRRRYVGRDAMGASRREKSSSVRRIFYFKTNIYRHAPADLARSTFKLPSEIGNDVPPELRKKLTLAKVRELTARLRNVEKAGRDPVTERMKRRAPSPSFREAAIATHKAQAHGWSQRTADAFLSSLSEHAFPVIGKRRVDTTNAEDVASALTPIWTTKPAMAKKVRQRIATVLDYAAAKNWRDTEAPGNHVRALTGKPKSGKHFPAMPYSELPAYF